MQHGQLLFAAVQVATQSGWTSEGAPVPPSAGLTSACLEQLELVNTNLCQVHAVTGHSRLPNLASVLVTERLRYTVRGEAETCDHIARL